MQVNNYTKILIWTYGKVGTTSIANSFNSVNNDKTMEYVNSKSKHIDDYEAYQFHPNFCGEYLLNKYTNMLILTIVRNPIDRNISAFWENIKYFCPEWETMSIDSIIDMFNTAYNHDHTDTWLKEYFDVNHIDFDDFSFDLNKKYNKIIDNNQNTFLISRFEDMEYMMNNVYNNYVNIIPATENMGENKIYAEKYKDFKKKYKLPIHLIEKYKNHETSLKFYSKTELDIFLSKYT